MESLMRTYLLFENLWENGLFAFLLNKMTGLAPGFSTPVKAFRFVCDRTLHRGYFTWHGCTVAAALDIEILLLWVSQAE